MMYRRWWMSSVQRTVLKKHPAIRDDVGDLRTYRPLPSRALDQIDPFLFLNHHGCQVYGPQNSGLPFGPHPHRGFETVTFILKGDVAHQDSFGHKSVINAGGIQWMTAGKGLIHEEVSSPEFREKGGELEILQLWINLPARLKMAQPNYVGLQKEQIPSFEMDEGKVQVNLISGEWQGHHGPYQSLIDVQMTTIFFKEQGRISLSVSEERNIFFYVVSGNLNVNSEAITEKTLVQFDNEGDLLEIQAASDSVLLWGHALPLKEPVVAHGPFVMNTREEILEAIRDYQAGKFKGFE